MSNQEAQEVRAVEIALQNPSPGARGGVVSLVTVGRRLALANASLPLEQILGVVERDRLARIYRDAAGGLEGVMFAPLEPTGGDLPRGYRKHWIRYQEQSVEQYRALLAKRQAEKSARFNAPAPAQADSAPTPTAPTDAPAQAAGEGVLDRGDPRVVAVCRALVKGQYNRLPVRMTTLLFRVASLGHPLSEAQVREILRHHHLGRVDEPAGEEVLCVPHAQAAVNLPRHGRSPDWMFREDPVGEVARFREILRDRRAASALHAAGVPCVEGKGEEEAVGPHLTPRSAERLAEALVDETTEVGTWIADFPQREVVIQEEGEAVVVPVAEVITAVARVDAWLHIAYVAHGVAAREARRAREGHGEGHLSAAARAADRRDQALMAWERAVLRAIR